jgi:hypothetical protein
VKAVRAGWVDRSIALLAMTRVCGKRHDTKDSITKTPMANAIAATSALISIDLLKGKVHQGVRGDISAMLE